MNVRITKRKVGRNLHQDEIFNGWSGFVAEASRPCVVPHGGYDAPVSDDRSPSTTRWARSASLDEALRLAKSGWPEGLRKVRKVKDDLDRSIGELVGIEASYQVAGDEVDVGVTLSGEPENMIEYALVNVDKPVVRFVVGLAASASVKPEEYYNRGAAVCAVIDHLESEGIRCEVVLKIDVISGYAITNNFHEVVELKRASEPLDIDKLAFALAHPSTLRRLYFRIAESRSVEEYKARGGGSYGSVGDTTAEKDEILVPGMFYGDGVDWSTAEGAAEGAKALLKLAKA